ncbi:MAG: hypothetical protein J4432_03555 [DPANN group archaeon]|nr:hypothetical protein [DPANN group archaeon]
MTVKIWKIDRDKVRELNKVLEAPEIADAEGKIILNQFARNGYQLKDGKIIGFEESKNYLYIEASDEFFMENAKKIDMPGVTELSGEEFETVKKKIEEEQADSIAGMGSVFEGF